MRPAFRRVALLIVPCILIVGVGLEVCWRTPNVPRPIGWLVPPAVPARPPFVTPRAWLVRKLETVERAEAWNGSIPAQPGDEIWEFSSPPPTWEQELGTHGRCLLRRGQILEGIADIVS